jgi:hypothetical protein
VADTAARIEGSDISSPTRSSTGRASSQLQRQARRFPSPQPISKTDLGLWWRSVSRRSSCLWRYNAGLKLIDGGENSPVISTWSLVMGEVYWLSADLFETPHSDDSGNTYPAKLTMSHAVCQVDENRGTHGSYYRVFICFKFKSTAIML